MASPAKRREALLNEYKGNLYEFLTAQALAKIYGKEAEFIKSLREDFFSMLSQQEAFVREFYPELLGQLPILAQGLAEKIAEKIELKPISVSIVGKAAAGADDQNLGETDITLASEDGEAVLVSVKLSKTGAFVNTKSAGIKSFLSKYFEGAHGVEAFQEEFAKFFDRQFDSMAYKLHEMADVTYSPGFENWKKEGLPQLPGDLPQEMREVFLQTLGAVSNELCNHLDKLKDQDPKAFVSSLCPLIGYSRSDIFQATTFYQQGYELDVHKVEDGSSIIEDLRVETITPRENTTSFDVQLNDRILQIRIKAMNKFTGKGFKVNCAVKNLN